MQGHIYLKQFAWQIVGEEFFFLFVVSSQLLFLVLQLLDLLQKSVANKLFLLLSHQLLQHYHSTKHTDEDGENHTDSVAASHFLSENTTGMKVISGGIPTITLITTVKSSWCYCYIRNTYRVLTCVVRSMLHGISMDKLRKDSGVIISVQFSDTSVATGCRSKLIRIFV